MNNILVVVLFYFLAVACNKKEDHIGQPAAPYTPFHTQQLAAASNYSEINGGSSVLVMQNGTIIYENYHNGSDQNTATHIHSGTKGFFAALTAVALQNGVLSGYDENVSQSITEWQDNTAHPGKDGITLRHLASLTSGLSQNFGDIGGGGSNVPNIYAYAVDSLNLNHVPGSFFQYGPSHYYVFGEFLTRKLSQAGIDQNPLEYLETEIFDKIGLTYSSWVHDEVGNPHIPNGCHITPRNWVKFGQLLLQKGKWGEVQVIQEEYANDLFEPHGINPGHGVFLWLNKQGGYPPFFSEQAPNGAVGSFIFFDGYTDIIACLGAGKNRMYIIPSLNAVVVRQTLEGSDNFSDNEFLELILPD